MKIVLPFPDRRLSPNARLHWRARLKPKQIAKTSAWAATVATPGFYETRRALGEGEGPIAVQIRFYPPDNRRRDDDNIIASFKAARDGVADALGVDDRRFRPHYFFEDPAAPGRVEVEFA